jgi:hypothetical protein
MKINQIGNKLLLFLIAVLVLMNVSREENHALNAKMAVSNLLKVLAEKPPPEMIGEKIGVKTPPTVRPRPQGQTKIIQRLDFGFPDKNMSYIFYVDDNKIAHIGSNETFNLQRGIKYEELEKIYLTALTKYFGFPPVESSTQNTFGGSRKSFIWISHDNNLSARVELYIIYDKRSLAKHNMAHFLWRKRDHFSASIFAENQ